MAIYRVQGPDGKIHRFEGPDNATPQAIEAFASQTFGPKEESYNPSEGGGTLSVGPFDTGIPTSQGVDRFLSNAGADMASMGRGVGSLVGLSDQAATDEARRLEAPLRETGAGKAGGIVGRVALTVPSMFIPGANTLAGASLIGAATGALTTEGGAADRALGAAAGGLGGAVGQKAGQVAGKVLKSSGGTLTAAQQQAKATGDRLGLRLTPGYASGSKSLQRAEAALQSNPVTSGGFDSLASGNQKIVNQIAAKAIGQNSDELSAPVLGKAFDDIGAVYDKVRTPAPVQLNTSDITRKLLGVIDDNAGQYAGATDVSGNALFKRLSDFAQTGQVTQEQLASLSSNLGKAVKNNFTTPSGDRAMGSALAQTKEIVDELLEGSLSGSLAKEFAKARGQYRTLMQLTANTNVVNPASGNVNANALANVLQRTDRTGYLRGGTSNDLYDAARFSQAFPRIVGDSGTATRSMGPADYIAALPARVAMLAYLNNGTNALASAGAAGLQGTQNALAAGVRGAALPAGLALSPQAGVTLANELMR